MGHGTHLKWGPPKHVSNEPLGRVSGSFFVPNRNMTDNQKKCISKSQANGYIEVIKKKNIQGPCKSLERKEQKSLQSKPAASFPGGSLTDFPHANRFPGLRYDSCRRGLEDYNPFGKATCPPS